MQQQNVSTEVPERQQYDRMVSETSKLACAIIVFFINLYVIFYRCK
jgi:hypothetical protein